MIVRVAARLARWRVHASEAGQSTAEYALVLLGAAAVTAVTRDVPDTAVILLVICVKIGDRRDSGGPARPGFRRVAAPVRLSLERRWCS